MGKDLALVYHLHSLAFAHRNSLAQLTLVHGTTSCCKENFHCKELWDSRTLLDQINIRLWHSDQDPTNLCSINALFFQDTLYTHSNCQFYSECDITGTVTSFLVMLRLFFQNCNIRTRQHFPINL